MAQDAKGKSCRRQRGWTPGGVRMEILVGAALAVFIVLATSCSKDEGETGPGQAVVEMSGQLDFPSGDAVDPASVTVGFGDGEAQPDSDGIFAIEGNGGIPGLAIAYMNDSIPLLLAIAPDPSETSPLVLNAHSTALALAFLNPFICIGEADGAEEVLGLLEGLPEMTDLEELIEARLADDPAGLIAESAEVDSAISRVVSAYINSYPEEVARNYPSARLMANDPSETPGLVESASPEIFISPGNTVSGHKITHVSEETFSITNERGRWALCETPTESFYVMPNGTLLDGLKGKLWPPSVRDFELEPEVNGDTLAVVVYGAGFSSEPDNLFDALTSGEQDNVLAAGTATVLFEFVPQIIGVITNTTKYTPREDIAQAAVVQALGYLRHGRIADRMREYYLAGQYMKSIWFLTKEAINLIVNDDTFRSKYCGALAKYLSETAIKRLTLWVAFPAKVILLGDNVTSIMKTIYGFTSTRFKTSFLIWSEQAVTEVGNVSGSVHDKDGGLPVAGVTVDLLGDEDNPLHPSHQDVTESDGGFYFSNIMTGEMTLQFTKTGYKTKQTAVTVEKDKTVNAAVEIEKVLGGTGGNIVDEILLENGVQDPKFKKQCSLTAREIGGQNRVFPYTIDDGDYNLNIEPGHYWIVAEHEDYYPDSVEVTVTGDGDVPAPRDLLMKPRGTMSGDIYIDMANDGTYETHFAISFSDVGELTVTPDACPGAGSPFAVIDLVGLLPEPGNDGVEIMINPNIVTGTGYFNLGSVIEVPCPGYNGAAAVSYLTERVHCTLEDVGTYPMTFFIADRSQPACNCGLTSFGNIVLNKYGRNLTDVIEGSIVSELAGWASCMCYCCEDVDGDGVADDYVVNCARARLELEFKVLVGTGYKIESAQGMFVPAALSRR